MGAIAFDTLKFAKRPQEGGFTEQQAEVLATAEAELIEDNLATKRDIAEIHRAMKELELSLQRDLKSLEVSLKRDMKDLVYRMTIKLSAMLVVAVGAMATLVKVL